MPYKTLITVLILVLSSAAPVRAQEQESVCTPIAMLFEAPICIEDITVDKEHVAAISQQYEQQGLDPEKALDSKSLETLKTIIWARALDKKFSHDMIAPTDTEIDLYRRSFRQTLDRSHAENKANARKIEALLNSDTYAEEDKAKLRRLLASIKTSIAFYEERESYNKDMPPEFHDMVEEAERGIAEKMVREWKIDGALYKQYGGMVVARKSKLEPIEAYGKFLRYIKGEGKLSILDPDYKNVFEELELYVEAAKKIPAEHNKELYDNYFSSIQWQFENGANLPQN